MVESELWIGNRTLMLNNANPPDIHKITSMKEYSRNLEILQFYLNLSSSIEQKAFFLIFNTIQHLLYIQYRIHNHNCVKYIMYIQVYYVLCFYKFSLMYVNTIYYL